MSGTGSLDNIEDAIACLEREGCVFLLFVGRIGESYDRVWSMNRGNTGPETKARVMDTVAQHMEKHWDDEDTP